MFLNYQHLNASSTFFFLQGYRQIESGEKINPFLANVPIYTPIQYILKSEA